MESAARARRTGAWPTSVVPLPVGPGPWTVEDLAGLPDVGLRFEVVDGNLLVSPPPTLRHQAICKRLARILDDAVPPGWTALNPAGLRVVDGTREPDVLVVREEAAAKPGHYQADAVDVLLAVEVVSPSSRTDDRVTKPVQYAEVGVPAYWRVETEWGLELHAYELREAAYVEVGVWGRGENVELQHPFPVRFRLDQLSPDD